MIGQMSKDTNGHVQQTGLDGQTLSKESVQSNVQDGRNLTIRRASNRLRVPDDGAVVMRTQLTITPMARVGTGARSFGRDIRRLRAPVRGPQCLPLRMRRRTPGPRALACPSHVVHRGTVRRDGSRSCGGLVSQFGQVCDEGPRERTRHKPYRTRGSSFRCLLTEAQPEVWGSPEILARVHQSTGHFRTGGADSKAIQDARGSGDRGIHLWGRQTLDAGIWDATASREIATLSES
jgi:hypothetical protein